MTPSKVLVTGGAGYIGSTICSALEHAGHTPVIIDSLVNGYEQFVRGRPFYKGDIADAETVGSVFDDHPDIDFAIHCAALTVVPDSVERPYEYYDHPDIDFAIHCGTTSSARLISSGCSQSAAVATSYSARPPLFMTPCPALW